jgi:hypothetical protein
MSRAATEANSAVDWLVQRSNTKFVSGSVVAGDHSEAFAVLPGAGRFDGSVESQ